ncbi:MAG: DUF4115 domain-containing protein [Actinomycetes bacterium]
MAIALLLVVAYVLTRDDGDGVTTAGKARSSRSPSTPAAQSPTSAPATTTPTPSQSATTSPSGTATKHPPTLSFVVLRNSYITVRVPGGRTLVSRVFRKGQRRTFDHKRLQVVNGRPSAVRFTVNGKPRKPGTPTEPETFTVGRR